MLRWLMACIVVSCAAGEPSWPPLPDPYVLGARLVTIEHLRHMQVAVPVGLNDAEVLALYDQSSGVTVDADAVLSDGDLDEDARRRDHITRLRQMLHARFGFTVADDLDEDELNTLVATHTRQQNEHLVAETIRMSERERKLDADEIDSPTLIKNLDQASGVTWQHPRLAADYDARRSPYAICFFGSHPEGGRSPLLLRLVVFLAQPPTGEPQMILHAGAVDLQPAGWSLQATALPDGSLRTVAECSLTEEERDHLRQIINHPSPTVEYRFGILRLVVGIDEHQRQAMRLVLAAHAALTSAAR